MNNHIDIDTRMDLDTITNNFAEACKINDVKTIKTLFGCNYDFTIYKKGYYKLANYNYNGPHFETLKYLLDNTKPEYINDELKYGIIISAIGNNNINIVEMMLTKYIINFDYSSRYGDIITKEAECCGLTLMKYCERYNLDEYIWLFEKYIISKHCKCCNQIKNIITNFYNQNNKKDKNTELSSKLQELITEINKYCNH